MVNSLEPRHILRITLVFLTLSAFMVSAAEITPSTQDPTVNLTSDTVKVVLDIPESLLTTSENATKLAQLVYELQSLYRIEHPDPDLIQQLHHTIEHTCNVNILEEAQSFARNITEKKFRILSLDGGGMRGFMSCLFLSHLTHITQKPIHELFDMIIATSTGTLIAAGLAVRKPEGYKPKFPLGNLLPYQDSIASPYYTPEELAALYVGEGPKIFSNRTWSYYFNGATGPTYRDHSLNQTLKDFFQDKTLKDLELPVFLTAYQLDIKEVITYSTLKPEAPTHNNIFIWEALRGCVAAPTIFTPVTILNKVICDAGICLNNPSALAITKAAKYGRILPKDIALFSLGCGYCEDNTDLGIYQSMGLIGWLKYIMNTLFDGRTTDSLIHDLKETTSLPSYYFRVSPQLKSEHMIIDLITQEGFKALSTAAQNEIKLRNDDFYRLAEILTGEKIEKQRFRPIPQAISHTALHETTPLTRQTAASSSTVDQMTLPPLTTAPLSPAENVKKEEEPSSLSVDNETIQSLISLQPESSPASPAEDQPPQSQTGLGILGA